MYPLKKLLPHGGVTQVWVILLDDGEIVMSFRGTETTPGQGFLGDTFTDLLLRLVSAMGSLGCKHKGE